MDQNEVRGEIQQILKLISAAGKQAKDEGVSPRLIDKITSAQMRAEVLLKKLAAKT